MGVGESVGLAGEERGGERGGGGGAGRERVWGEGAGRWNGERGGGGEGVV